MFNHFQTDCFSGDHVSSPSPGRQLSSAYFRPLSFSELVLVASLSVMVSRKETAGTGSSAVGSGKAKGKSPPGDSAVKQVQIDGLIFNIMSKKRGCKFNDDLRSEFPFIKEIKSDYMVKCEKCNGEFSISHGGKNNISKHLETQKHKRYLNTAAASSKIQEFFRKTTYGDEEKKLALAEGLMSFHAVNHNHSFRSMDCTSQLVKKLFNKKFACARTKSEAIVCNVLFPYAFSELNKNLEKKLYPYILTHLIIRI